MSNLGGKNVSEDTDKDLGVDSIVAGTNIDNIDSTDPRNPIINASAGAGGEVNTASNQGAGVGKVFKQKTGVDLELKSIKGGTGITISNDTDEVTINADSQLNNTTKGDLEGFSTVAARIPVGSNGQVLTADSAEALGLKWATPAAGGGDVATDAIWDAKGDLAGGTGADTAARLAVGTNDQVLTADSAEATGMKWATAAGGGSGVSAGMAERQADIAIATTYIVEFDTETYDDDNFIDIAGAATEIAVGTASRADIWGSVRTTNTVTAGSNFIFSINHFNSADVLQSRVASHQASTTSGITEVIVAAHGVPVSSGDYFQFTIFSSDTTTTLDIVKAVVQDVSP